MAKPRRDQVMVATEMVERGTAIRQVARQLGVAESGLRYRLKRPLDGRDRASALDGWEARIDAVLTRFGETPAEGQPPVLKTDHRAFREFLRVPRGTYKRWDLRLLLDRGSGHTAKATEQLAAELRIRLTWLPTACPELNPVEPLWRGGKQHVCANRAYADVDEYADRFIKYLCGLSDEDALRLAGLRSGNYWLTT